VEVLQQFDTILILYHCNLYTQENEQDLVARLRGSGFETSIRERTQEGGWIIATNLERG
jgi:hypothetical protein